MKVQRAEFFSGSMSGPDIPEKIEIDNIQNNDFECIDISKKKLNLEFGAS